MGMGKGKEEVRGRRKEKRARNGKEIRGGEEKEGEGFFVQQYINRSNATRSGGLVMPRGIGFGRLCSFVRFVCNFACVQVATRRRRSV